MNALSALLTDRRRSQRGSVLSGVLIITAFLAIISAAMMTELSTNYVLSSALLNRVNKQATVNSAVELALNQLQSTPLNAGCPALSPVTLNGRTAAVSYLSCWPTIDTRSPRFASIASPASFAVDGSHSVIPGTSQDLYVVGDSGGTVYSYPFGQTSPKWSMALGSRITGPPMAMQDAAASPPDTGGTGGVNADISYLIPTAGGAGSGCGANPCVVLLGQDVPATPDITCYLATGGAVVSRPAAGVVFPQAVFFGDSTGNMYAYNATEFSCVNGGPGTLLASTATPSNAGIVAGPIVLQNLGRDDLYVVTSKGTTSQLVHFAYRTGSLTLVGTPLNLPFANPVGVAVEGTSVGSRLVITFAGGGIAIARIDADYDPSLGMSAGLGTGVAGAPYWCACPGGPQIAAAGLNGTLYVLDTSLNVVASYAGGSAVRTAPASDGVGEWFYGADDGYLHELQLTPGQSTMVQVAQYGGLGGVGSSVQVGPCPAGICIYLGTSNNAYVVALNARDAKIAACLSNSPPACSGDNPRLWAQVEVGAAGNPRTVHVQGWSYYSP